MSFKLSAGCRPSQRAGIRKLLTPLFLGLLVGLVSANAANAAPVGTFRGQAYGTFANNKAGPVAATLGRSAFLPCPCEGTDGETLSNRVIALAAGENDQVLTAENIDTTGVTNSAANTASIEFTSSVEGLSAFNGLITAAAVTAVAHTNVGPTNIAGDTSRSRFANLRIAGKGISANVEPNTRVRLPGIGFAILNRVQEEGNGIAFGSITVDMIVIHIQRENNFDLAVGSEIIIGHATSGFARQPVDVIMGGAAWGAEGNNKVDNKTRNQIGRAAFITVGCRGTNGETLRNSSAEISADEVLSMGDSRTTAFGGPTQRGTTARTTASVDGVELLNGLIVAATVKAVAQETIASNGTRTRSTVGSGVAGLRILGTAISTPVLPNTKVLVPGFGYVMLNEQKIPPASSDARTSVNGLRLVITRNNRLDLPIGSHIIVAHAQASAKKFSPAAGLMASR